MGARDESSALYWTTPAGRGALRARVEPVRPADRCAQAARVGFAGIGLWHADLEHVLETRTLAEVRPLLDDHGLEPPRARVPRGTGSSTPTTSADGIRRAARAAVRAAAELPAHHIKVGNIVGHRVRAPTDRRALRRAVRRRCPVHRREDRLRVHAVRRQRERRRQGARGRRGADAPNGGLALDTWHLGKLGLEPDELRRIPPRFLSWVELCDGPYEYAEDRLDEVINRRKLPGEGEFPFVSYVAVCRELGYDGPWGVEVLSEELRNLPIEQIFDRAYETTAAQLASPSGKGASVAENGLSKERLTWMYTQMARIREFEERVKRTFEEHPGVIRGHTHLADGAEASIVGSLAALGPDDQLTATYRGHGYPIALGTDTKALMAEIYGKETGICKGYGGSMHFVDVGRGFLGTSGIVGQGIPHAAGAAWAAQIRGKGQVVLSFFGDGASKQGAFHETLNIASLWKLPVVFVMENNNYQAYTRVEQEDANAAAGEPLAVKAKAYSTGRHRRRRRPGASDDGLCTAAMWSISVVPRTSRAVGGQARRRAAEADDDRVQDQRLGSAFEAPLTVLAPWGTSAGLP